MCYARHLESGPAAAREWLAACDAKSAEAQRADSDKKREEAVASCAGKGLQTEYKGVQLHLAPGSKTGYAGVWLNGRGSGYRVALEQNGSRRDLGRFNDVLEAALAYAQYVQGRAAAATAPPAPAAARPGGKRKRAQEPPPVAAEERSEEGQGS